MGFRIDSREDLRALDMAAADYQPYLSAYENPLPKDFDPQATADSLQAQVATLKAGDTLGRQQLEQITVPTFLLACYCMEIFQEAEKQNIHDIAETTNTIALLDRQQLEHFADQDANHERREAADDILQILSLIEADMPIVEQVRFRADVYAKDSLRAQKAEELEDTAARRAYFAALMARASEPEDPQPPAKNAKPILPLSSRDVTETAYLLRDLELDTISSPSNTATLDQFTAHTLVRGTQKLCQAASELRICAQTCNLWDLQAYPITPESIEVYKAAEQALGPAFTSERDYQIALAVSALQLLDGDTAIEAREFIRKLARAQIPAKDNPAEAA